jgi:transglycosylase-like protein with SLT domain
MTRHPPVLACLMLVGCLTAAPIAVAAGQEIPRGYRQVAVEYGLPPALLYATALTASGRMLQGRRLQPWPWTLTLEGRRHHYPTRVAAYRALTAYLARGHRKVRVGVMGLPWHRYGGEFRNPWAALDSYTNLRFAARRLAPHLASRSLPRVRGVPGALDHLIAQLAPRYALDPKLVREVVATESAYNPRARSSKGAQGLMQLMPATALRFGVQDVWDPEQNLTGGMRYLDHLLAYYRGDLARVLAAYNAGEDAVDRHRGLPPYSETRAYVARILKRYGRSMHPYRPKFAGES